MTEPVAVIALRALIEKWREIGNRPNRPTGFIICADDLDALVARVEPQEQTMKPLNVTDDRQPSPQAAEAREMVAAALSIPAQCPRCQSEHITPHPAYIFCESCRMATTLPAAARVEPPPQEQAKPPLRFGSDTTWWFSRQKPEEHRAIELLRRLRQWDHLDGAHDGPYWKSEIDAVLAAPPSPPTQEK